MDNQQNLRLTLKPTSLSHNQLQDIIETKQATVVSSSKNSAILEED